MRRQQDVGSRQDTGWDMMRTARRASKVGDGSDPDGFARCLHFLEVVKSETWRAGHESGRRWYGSVRTADQQVDGLMLCPFSA